MEGNVKEPPHRRKERLRGRVLGRSPQGRPSRVSGIAPLNTGGCRSPRRGNCSFVPPLAPGPSLTPASAASDQFWLLRRISSTDQGRSHTGSGAGGRSESGLVRFICSEG